MQNEILHELKVVDNELQNIDSDDFDIIADTSSHVGNWVGITVIAATFPNNATDNEVKGVGKNLSAFNDQLPDGLFLSAKFTKIKITGGLVIAHKK